MRKVLLLITLIFPGAAYAQLTAPWEHYMGNTRESVCWGTLQRNAFLDVRNDAQAERIKAILSVNDFMSNPNEIGLESGRDERKLADFMNDVEASGGASVRDAYYEVSKRWLKLSGASSHDMFLQMGNEINSFHFAQTMRKWAADYGKPYPHPASSFKSDGDSVGRNDRGYIGYFAEYFIAPALEGVIKARAENSGSHLYVLLGSLANARNQEAQYLWLPALWNYEIRGDYAPTLKGVRIGSLMDGITIHYLLSSAPLLDKAEAFYRDYIVSEGKKVYTSEELGSASWRGLGATVGLPVFARYMDVWTRMNLRPEQAKLIYYSAHLSFTPSINTANSVLDHLVTEDKNKEETPCPEASADYILSKIENFIPAAVLENSSSSLGASSQVSEKYAFSDTRSRKSIVILVGDGGNPDLEYITVRGRLSRKSKASVTICRESSTTSIPASITKAGKGYIRISIPSQPFHDAAALICLSL